MAEQKEEKMEEKGMESKERKIINLRYFKNKTQSQVAKEMGMTQVQVSRLEKKILNSMRNEKST